MKEKIAEQKNQIEDLRQKISRFNREHEEYLKTAKAEFETKMLKLSSYHGQFIEILKENLGKAEKILAEILTKFCESCGEEVEIRSSTGSSLHSDSLYICKVCGHIQGVYIE